MCVYSYNTFRLNFWFIKNDIRVARWKFDVDGRGD